MLVLTVSAKYSDSDYLIKWTMIQIMTSLMLFGYSLYFYLKSRSYTTLIISVIFLGEMVGVLMGYNLSTHFFPELMLGLMFLGVLTFMKKK
jgi:hypothetical protein